MSQRYHYQYTPTALLKIPAGWDLQDDEELAHPSDLRIALCKALGVPLDALKATLTLEGNKPPLMEIETLAQDASGRLKPDPAEPWKIGRMKFILRLEPTKEPA